MIPHSIWDMTRLSTWQRDHVMYVDLRQQDILSNPTPNEFSEHALSSPTDISAWPWAKRHYTHLQNVSLTSVPLMHLDVIMPVHQKLVLLLLRIQRDFYKFLPRYWLRWFRNVTTFLTFSRHQTVYYLKPNYSRVFPHPLRCAFH
jgi:hypothetical protein